MNYLRSITIMAIASLLMFSSPSYCAAQGIEWDEGKKEDVFRTAREQDKFVLVVIGTYSCTWCKRLREVWLEGTLLKKIVNDNYYPWFVFQDSEIHLSISNYTAEYDALLDVIGKARPIVLIINPDETDDDFIIFWPPESRDEQTVRQKITPPSLLSFSDLKWYETRNEVFNLAKAQGKFILKLVGRSTSPNSKKVIKQFNESPLKEVLEENFVLWYSSDVKEANLGDEASEEEIKTLPYITIVDPDEPDILLEEEWGPLNEEKLEEMLLKYTVSNEKILTKNKVFISGNVLHISNQTTSERIRIYTLNGQNITTIIKNDYDISFDVSQLPKGVFIIHSTAGWSAKVVKQ